MNDRTSTTFDAAHDTSSSQERQGFAAELEALYRKIVVRSDPRACLPILAERFDRRWNEIRNRRRGFSADLGRVFERINVDPRRHLRLLQNRFIAWRSHTVEVLGRYLSDLPKDDPLCSAISLFGTMDLGRLERAHTKVLAWLLNPTKEHEFGTALIDSLIKHLNPGERAAGRLESLHSEPEKFLPNGRRLDVFLAGKSIDETGKVNPWFMIIEAKIDAQEGVEQLEEYDKWIDASCQGIVTRVFLTPDARKGETSAKAWKPLSFLELACVFRQALPELTDKAGYHFLRHYLTGLLKDVCRWSLPIRDAQTCADPYGFLDYMKAVHTSREPGATS